MTLGCGLILGDFDCKKLLTKVAAISEKWVDVSNKEMPLVSKKYIITETALVHIKESDVEETHGRLCFR